MKKHAYTNIDETLYTMDLTNGLTVGLLPKQDMEKTFAIFSTAYGSIDQTFIPKGQEKPITVPEGIAHFLEHKLFEKEDRDVFSDFSRQGASANAYTSFTNTAYLFSATSNIRENLQTLLDFVQEPYFSDESVEKEKGIITQEILMYDDQPEWQSFMGTIKGLYREHPVNIDIAGTVESIQKITKDHLYTCYETFYHPSNMTLFITGNFNHEEIADFIVQNQENKQFEPSTGIHRIYPDEPTEANRKEYKINMPVSVPKCTIGIKEMPHHQSSDDYLKRQLLQEMVLDHFFSKSGSFFQSLYDQDLIDSSFNFSTTLEQSFGYTLIGGNTKHPETFIDKTVTLLQSTAKMNFTKAEIQKMKNKQIGQLLRGMNSLEFIANNFIHYSMHEVDFFKIIEMIQNLTTDDFQIFLENWINEEQLTVCRIEPE